MLYAKYMKDPQPVVPEKRFAEFRCEIRGDLPPDYEAFLRQTDGGKPLCRNVDVTEDGDVSGTTLTSFLGLNPDKQYNLFTANESYRSNQLGPPEFFVIAYDAGANNFLIGYRGPCSGQIWYRTTEGKLWFVAASFCEFFSMLEMEEPARTPTIPPKIPITQKAWLEKQRRDRGDA